MTPVFFVNTTRLRSQPRFADLVIIWVLRLPERTKTGLITASDQTVRGVNSCNSWFHIFMDMCARRESRQKCSNCQISGYISLQLAAINFLSTFKFNIGTCCQEMVLVICTLQRQDSARSIMLCGLPYKFCVLGQIGLSKQCRPRSDCF